MPHLSKLYDRLLLLRLRTVIDPHLQHMQNGFREGRGTTHHVLALEMLLDLAKTRKYPIHGCFVDFSKAFDSISWWAIREQLKFWHVHQTLIDAVFDMMQGHVLKIRCDGVISDSDIPVEVGVLQGDTLAPYLFVIVLDAVLRKLPQHCGLLLSKSIPKKLTTRQKALGHHSEKRLCGLGFADDVVLLAHSCHDLQQLFHSFEAEALTVGLRVNLGKGKTERFFIDDDGHGGELHTINKDVIPIVDSYKYLGVQALSFEKEFESKRGKTWAILRTFQHIWSSNVAMHVKRQLFRSLVEPVWTYGLCAWPLTVSRTQRLDGAYGKQLRYACGLPPAYISHESVHTEQLYGDTPFLSTMLRARRLKLIGHAVREHIEERRAHPLVDVLLFEPGVQFPPKRGPRTTISQNLMKECHVAYIEQLIEIFTNRKKCKHFVSQVFSNAQSEVWSRINRRRQQQADAEPLILHRADSTEE